METLTNSGIKTNFLPPPFHPYNFQIPVIKKMVQVVLEGKDGLVIQPTATGKSVEAAFAARACILLHQKRGLYLYSENEGLQQARLKFSEIFANNGVVCANFFGYGRDEFVHRADMVFASFQSLNSHHGKWYKTFEKNHFDFIIVNEAHHSHAVTYKEVVDYFECPKIGMTATERRMDGKDIREIFPEIITEIRLEEAIVNRWVTAIEYHVLSNGLSTQALKQICKEVLEEGKRISIKQLNENIFVEMLDNEMLTEVYKYAFPVNSAPKQTLFFCENITHAKVVLKLLKRDGKSAEAIHSKQPQSKNRSIIKDFRSGKIQFLLSVDKLNEDIDVPNAEIGVFLRATDSETVFWQQLGRLLRRTEWKEKAIILDFVANVERIIMVQQMVKTIEDFATKGGEDLFQRTLMHVKGEGFDFSFSNELKNIFEVFKVLKSGHYPTWEEASAVAIKAGIQSSDDYSNNYKKVDYRLPSSPTEQYVNFPGWNVFLKREVAPKGWGSVAELINSEDFKHVAGSIRKYVAQQEIVEPKLVGNYWNEDGKYCIKFCHPKLIKIIKTKFQNKKPAPKGWMTASMISREYSVSRKVVIAFVDEFRVKNPTWFRFYLNHSSFLENYHPTLVKMIIEKFDKRKPASKGWLTAKMIVSKEKQLSLAAIIKFVDQYRVNHPEWFVMGYVKRGTAEHYHPDLISLIISESEKLLPPSKGWSPIGVFATKGGINNAKLIIDRDRSNYQEWIKMYCINGELKECYHPDLIKKVSAEIKVTVVAPPQGWMICNEIAQHHEVGVKWKKVKKVADEYRHEHPEWFKFFRIAFHRRNAEHYHPDLVLKIKEKFAKNRE